MATTRDDVYRKFGETSEAAQLLETELGTLLLEGKLVEDGLLENPDPASATALYDRINRQTLGQLIRSLGLVATSAVEIERMLRDALAAPNRLVHSFYLKHNLRLHSDDGRELMLRDLESIHETLLDAYKVVLALCGVDVERLLAASGGKLLLPIGHLPIRT